MEPDIEDDGLDPRHKRVMISVKGNRHQEMIDAAILEAAAFLGMMPRELTVLSCGMATPVEYTRFPTDLNHDIMPELWAMEVLVGVFIPPKNPEKDS
jgi:hypothetical protein